MAQGASKVKGVVMHMVKQAKVGETPNNIMPVIGIRADANDTIASGHVMRCIAIAGQLIAAGSRVVFYTADEYAGNLLERAGMQYVCLHTRWDRMEEETSLLRQELLKAGCTKLLVDSYQVTDKYFRDLSDLCKLIYMDDCFEAVYPVDMVIDYNAYHVRFPYEEAYDGSTKLLLGTAYVPLREEFVSDTERCVQNDGSGMDNMEDTRILLSSGGGDPCNALSGILAEAVRDPMLRNMTFDVVVGGYNRNVEELERHVKEHPNVRLHYQVNHMAELMRQCTVAVSAAGTTLYELCATQTPTVFFGSADNQQYDHEYFAEDERMLYAGDIRDNRDECLSKICSHLKLILADKKMRDNMKRKLYEVTDGRGARRIAEEIIGL